MELVFSLKMYIGFKKEKIEKVKKLLRKRIVRVIKFDNYYNCVFIPGYMKLYKHFKIRVKNAQNLYV